MFRKSGTATAILMAGAIALSGCAAAGDDDSSTEGGGTLTLGLIQPVSTFSAAGSNWANQSPYMQAVYDALLRANPANEVEPNLATEWSYNEDSTVLTMTLRDDVTFTDGTAFTADVAAQNLLRFRDGTSPNASLLRNMADAKAVDDTTLEITLTAPDPAFLLYLTQNAGLQESPAAFDSADIDTIPVGSGPYTLNENETVAGSTYVFDRNDDYWNPADQHYAKIVMSPYLDTVSMLNAIQGGQVNGAVLADNSSLDQVTAAGYEAHAYSLNWVGLLLSDRDGVLNPALGEVDVRRAINHAFDRDALLTALGQGYGTVTDQIFNPKSAAYDDELDSTYSYDPEKAKELLADAGYPDGFELTMPSSSAFPPATFTLIAQQLADIGITVTYEDTTAADYLPALLSSKYAASYMSLQTDASSWQLAQTKIAATSTWNVFKVDDPTVQGYISTMQTGDTAAYDDASRSLNAYVVDQAWFAPFYRPEQNFVTDANTAVQTQVGNAYPYLWNISPKG